MSTELKFKSRTQSLALAILSAVPMVYACGVAPTPIQESVTGTPSDSWLEKIRENGLVATVHTDADLPRFHEQRLDYANEIGANILDEQYGAEGFRIVPTVSIQVVTAMQNQATAQIEDAATTNSERYMASFETAEPTASASAYVYRNTRGNGSLLERGNEAVGTGTDTSPGPYSGTVPACTPVIGSGRDPCERRVPWVWPELTGKLMIAQYAVPYPPQTVRQEMDDAYRRWTRVPHQIIRGVVLPGSTRCESHASPILSMDGPEDTFHSFPGATDISCFADVSVREYIVGIGPKRVTIIAATRTNDHRSLDFDSVPRDSSYFAEATATVVDAFEGFEWIFWLHPPSDPTWGAWASVNYRSVQRIGNGKVIAVSRWSGWYGDEDVPHRERLELDIASYVKDAQDARSHYDRLYRGRVGDTEDAPSITRDASRAALAEYHSAIGLDAEPSFSPMVPSVAPIPTDPPLGFGAELNLHSRIELSWTAPDSGLVSGYKVVRRVPKGDFVTVVADTGSTDTTYTDTSAPMTAGVTYIYRVLALNEYGESLASNRATVVLPGPDAPADFTATNYEGDVVLTWSQPGVIMPSCYRIYRRAQGEQSFEWVVNCWSPELRSWRDDDVVSGTRYIYRIVPMIGYTESGATARASVRVR